MDTSFSANSMRILITGADTPLGALAAQRFRSDHELLLTGEASEPPMGVEDLPYTPANLREPKQAAQLLKGVDAVLHFSPYETVTTPDPGVEKELLDRAARGTYVLLHEALKAGVQRIILASRLDLMAAYPAEYLVDETWKPQPEATATCLAPYLAELTVREFVRAEVLTAVCLRFGPLGEAFEGTTPADAVSALERALVMDLEGRKYRWWLFHIGSTDRYPLGAAANPPFSFARTGRD